jgi:Ala-tRNA(Pro) deacylase
MPDGTHLDPSPHDTSRHGTHDHLIHLLHLLHLLDSASVDHRLIDHDPEGAGEAVRALRGRPAREAAKCIVPRVKVDRRTTRHVLALVPGDRRVDLDAVRALFAARYVGFSDPGTDDRPARAVPGPVLPFSFDPGLGLVADPDVVARPKLYFNAARLDRSFLVSGADYERPAQPRIERIAARAPA